jgi:integrase/recombinase XerD
MLDDMKLRNMAVSTRKIYVSSVAGFSAYHGRSPDQLTLEDVRDYQLHLVARGLKASSICPIMSALRFFYGTTLGNREAAAQIPLPRKADPLPAISAGSRTTGGSPSSTTASWWPARSGTSARRPNSTRPTSSCW